ncbi:hypothetical protein NMY22_g15101 [Coprinellus aureogranulatus]|nr:hypothetical protein NMY22_g15101 [Coprinellus aureogranulatus]
MRTDLAEKLALLLTKLGEQAFAIGRGTQELIDRFEDNPDTLCTSSWKEGHEVLKLCNEIEEGYKTLRLQPFSCSCSHVHTLLRRILSLYQALENLIPLLWTLRSPGALCPEEMYLKGLVGNAILNGALHHFPDTPGLRKLRNPAKPLDARSTRNTIKSLRKSMKKYSVLVKRESNYSTIGEAMIENVEDEKVDLPGKIQLDNLTKTLDRVLGKRSLPITDPKATPNISEAVPALLVRVYIVASRVMKIISNELSSVSDPLERALEWSKGLDVAKLHGRVRYYFQEATRPGSLNVRSNVRKLLARLARFDAILKRDYLRALQALEGLENGDTDTPINTAGATEDTEGRDCGVVPQKEQDLDAIWFRMVQKRASLDSSFHRAIAEYLSFADEDVLKAIRVAKARLRKRPRRATVEGYQSKKLPGQGVTTCTQRDSESSGSDCDECFDQRRDCAGEKRARPTPNSDALDADDISDFLQLLFKF